jgi:hypothetical protein
LPNPNLGTSISLGREEAVLKDAAAAAARYNVDVSTCTRDPGAEALKPFSVDPSYLRLLS